ncbi:MAG: SCO family protein [Nitrospinae bacterium]|nr:SCO family protein [Nitrospinota bacterium]
MKFSSSHTSFMAAFAMTLWAVASANAQSGFRPPVSDIDPTLLKIEEVKFLGLKLDENLAITGSDGREFTLGEFKGRPLILIISYFTCDGVCPAFNADLLSVLAKVASFSRVKPGVDFNVLTVSFDKNDDKESSGMFIRNMGVPKNLSESWRVGVFKNQNDIQKITSELGFRFFWSPGDRVFLHPGVYYFISPDMRVARILQGAVADPKDMELAIIDSKFDRLRPSDAMNMAYGMCYSYNYKDGKYILNYPLFISFGSLGAGAAVFLLAVRVYKRNLKDSRRA